MEKIIDLTKDEGARILEENEFLYDFAEIIEEKIFSILKKRENENNNKIEEFFNTNFFIDGVRGTGKTTVLLTLRKKLKELSDSTIKIDVLDTLNLSLNNTSILIYLLGYLYKQLTNDDFFCSYSKNHYIKENILTLYSKLINGFPYFLKCIKNEDYKKLCEDDIENLIEKLEINFVSTFKKFIQNYHELTRKDIILFLDDIDLVKDPEILYRTFVELAVVLSSEHVHIVGAGDLSNTYEILESFFGEKDKNISKETIKVISKSFIDKVFPLQNRVKLENLSIVDLQNIKVKYKIKDKSQIENLKYFLKQHPTFKFLDETSDYPNIALQIFEGYSIREFIQILRSINDTINKLYSGNRDFKIHEVVISNIISKFILEDTRFILDFPKVDIFLEFNEKNFKFSLKNSNLDNLYEYNKILAKKFYMFLFYLAQKEPKFKKFFEIENITDLRKKTFIPLFKVLYTINKNLYLLLYIWLFEVFNYIEGKLFFLSYFLIILSLLYGLPNILLYVEEKTDSIDEREKDLFYLKPIYILENISKFSDILDLYLAISSLHLNTNYKVYTVPSYIVEKFLFFNDIPIYTKYSNFYKVIPKYYKLWFLPLFAASYNTSTKSNYDDIIYEKFFVNYFDEDEIDESELEAVKRKKEKAEKFSEKLKENLRDILENINEIISSSIVNRNSEKILNPENVDTIIFTFIRTLNQGLLKNKLCEINFSKIKLSFYYLIPIIFLLASYDSRYYSETKFLLDFLIQFAITRKRENIESDDEKNEEFYRKFYKFISVFSYAEEKLEEIFKYLIDNLDKNICSSLLEKIREESRSTQTTDDILKINLIKYRNLDKDIKSLRDMGKTKMKDKDNIDIKAVFNNFINMKLEHAIYLVYIFTSLRGFHIQESFSSLFAKYNCAKTLNKKKILESILGKILYKVIVENRKHIYSYFEKIIESKFKNYKENKEIMSLVLYPFIKKNKQT